MSELGDVLELLAGAGRSFSTVRGRLEIRSAGVDDTRLRFWLEPPGKARVETEGPRPSVFVDDGVREWHSSPDGGTWTHHSQHAILHGFERLLEPAELMALFAFEPRGETTWAGRRALHAFARPRRPGLLHELPEGTDRHELLVDAERGVVLRLRSLDGEREIASSELTDVEFDELLPPETFVFVPAPGQEIREVEELMPTATEVTLEEAAELVPFTLFFPRRTPEGAQPSVSYAPGSEAAVALRYDLPEGLHWVVISESAHPQLTADDPGWEQVERAGRILAARRIGDQSQVVLQLTGTHVLLVSDLELDLVVEMAFSLEPVGNQRGGAPV